MTRLLCGPIIGHVTSSTARVLLEVDESIELFMCVLQEVPVINKDGDELGKVHVNQEDVRERSPRVFLFECLQGDTSYDILVPAVTHSRLGRLRTLPNDLTAMDIAVVSSNGRASQSDTYDLWERMWWRYKNGEDTPHLLLHIGDNLDASSDRPGGGSTSHLTDACAKYSDYNAPYVRARELLLGLPQEQWESKTVEILEIYRDEYRTKFNQKYTQFVLSHVPNLMLIADHGIPADFHSMPDESYLNSVEFFLGAIAKRVFYEYQRQLWDTSATTGENVENEFVYVTFGPVGIILFDSRTVWSFNKFKREPGDKSFYGKQQMESFVRCLNGRPEVNVWCLATSLPLLFLNTEATNEGPVQPMDPPDAVTDYINLGYRGDSEAILKEIKKWKSSSPNRNVLIVSGDVGVGGFTDITYNSPDVIGYQVLCRQVTTSALSNDPVGKGALIVASPHRFKEYYGDFTFHHFNWMACCNYAVLCLRSLKGPVHYTAKLVHDQGVSITTSEKHQWDLSNVKHSTCVCDIL